MDKWVLHSKTFVTALLSLLITVIASPAVLNIIPAKYLVYVPAVAVVLQTIYRSIPSDAQGGLTLTKPDTVDPKGR
jgi:hypothetical protein